MIEISIKTLIEWSGTALVTTVLAVWGIFHLIYSSRKPSEMKAIADMFEKGWAEQRRLNAELKVQMKNEIKQLTDSLDEIEKGIKERTTEIQKMSESSKATSAKVQALTAIVQAAISSKAKAVEDTKQP